MNNDFEPGEVVQLSMADLEVAEALELETLKPEVSEQEMPKPKAAETEIPKPKTVAPAGEVVQLSMADLEVADDTLGEVTDETPHLEYADLEVAEDTLGEPTDDTPGEPAEDTCPDESTEDTYLGVPTDDSHFDVMREYDPTVYEAICLNDKVEFETQRLDTDEASLERAGKIISSGGIVAFPTETVYGLGADALNSNAVKSVYEAKGRPSDNPMIVHIAEMGQLADLAKEITFTAMRLINAFWPGPITFVFKKMDNVPDETTGGLDTVAVRMPANDIARTLINKAGCPVAAPSANISGKPSPTKAMDVLEDMDGKIDAVIMGEDCEVGIESTVLDITGDVPTILRPGYITKRMLEDVLGSEVAYDSSITASAIDEDMTPKSPGMKYTHYSPKAKIRIVVGERVTVTAKLAELRKQYLREGTITEVLDYDGDSEAAAKDFFARLREFDREGVQMVLVRGLEEEDLGLSVMNRMLKSAGYDVLSV